MSRSFGELRSLLQLKGDPRRLWDALCDLLEVFPPHELDELVLPYVEDHLAHLPYAIRRVPARWFERLLRSEELPFLRAATSLDCAVRAMRLENIGAEVLAQTPYLERLRDVSLVGQLIHDSGLRALLRAPWMQEVEILRLDDNLLGDTGAASLAESAPMPSLRALSLRACGIARPGVATLCSSSLMLHLRILDLSRNELGWGIGSTLITRLTHANRLEQLLLRRCGIVTSDASAIGAMLAALPSLDLLDVGENTMGDEALAALLTASPDDTRTNLSLERNNLGERAVSALAQKSAVRELALHEPRLPSLAPLAAMSSLQKLSIRQDLSIRALGGCFARGFPALRELSLSQAPLAPGVLAELVSSSLTSTLETLRLDACSLDEDAIALLCQAPWERLRRLSLKLCNLSDAHAIQLARAPNLACLTELDLAHNDLGEPARRALATSSTLSPSITRRW